MSPNRIPSQRRVAIKTVLVLSAAVIAALILPNERAGADEEAIRSAANSWVRHYTSGDLDALMTLYDEAVIVALHGQPALHGKQAVHDYFAPRIGTADVTFELDYERIEVHGPIAYLVSRYWLRAVDRESGNVFKDAGRSMLVYQRGADGNWRIAADLDQATPDVAWPSPSGLE